MKKNNKQLYRGFTVAELLVSMLVVMVVLTALAPIIGPKKTKVYPMGGGSKGNGIFECYYERDNEGNLTLTQYSKIKNGAAKQDSISDKNYCEFDTNLAKGKKYTAYIVGAGKGLSSFEPNKIKFEFIEQSEEDGEAIPFNTITINRNPANNNRDFGTQIDRANSGGRSFSSELWQFLGSTWDYNEAGGRDVRESPNAYFNLGIKTPLGAPGPTKKNFIQKPNSTGECTRQESVGMSVPDNCTEIILPSHIGFGGRQILQSNKNRQFPINNAVNFENLNSLVANSANVNERQILNSNGSPKENFDINLGNIGYTISVKGSPDFINVCTDGGNWNEKAMNFKLYDDNEDKCFRDKQNTSKGTIKKINTATGVKTDLGSEINGQIQNNIVWSQNNDGVLNSQVSRQAGTLTFSNEAFKWRYIPPRASVNYYTSGDNGIVKYFSAKGGTGQKLKLYPSNGTNDSQYSYIEKHDENNANNGENNGESKQHNYNYDTKFYPSIGSNNDIFKSDQRIFFNDDDRFDAYINAISSIRPSSADISNEKIGLSNCERYGDCPGYGSPAYYPVARFSDFTNAASIVNVQDGSILFLQHNLRTPVVSNEQAISENDFRPSCGSGIPMVRDGDNFKQFVENSDSFESILFCKSNNHSNTPRGGAIVIVW